jgi:hypothetical protein
VSNIVDFLCENGYLPQLAIAKLCYGFYVPGQYASVFGDETIETLGLGLLSHIHFRVSLPGDGMSPLH